MFRTTGEGKDARGGAAHRPGMESKRACAAGGRRHGWNCACGPQQTRRDDAGAGEVEPGLAPPALTGPKPLPSAEPPSIP